MHTGLIVCCLLNRGRWQHCDRYPGRSACRDRRARRPGLPCGQGLETSKLRRVNLAPLARRHLSGENPDLGNDRSIADDRRRGDATS